MLSHNLTKLHRPNQRPRGLKRPLTASHHPSTRGITSATPTTARSREVGVATEMLLTKAEQVSDEGACAGRITPQAGVRAPWPVGMEAAVQPARARVLAITAHSYRRSFRCITRNSRGTTSRH